MSLIPQWKPPVIGMDTSWGFDETARPPWFMVGHKSSKAIRLDFGQGKLVKSVNPRIADIKEDASSDPQSRFFMIEGKHQGRTRIEVRDPRTNALEATLEVSVKARQKKSINFLFVEDKNGSRTTRPLGVADQLIDELNGIYEEQTNITFELSGAWDIKVDFWITDVLAETKDPQTKKMTGDAYLNDKYEWQKVFAKNRDAWAFNVYFVPVDPLWTTEETLVYTNDGNCIIEDGRRAVVYTLAHAIGMMLGCEETTDLNRMNQLMFWDPGVGKDFVPRSDDFIPKECANIMNP